MKLRILLGLVVFMLAAMVLVHGYARNAEITKEHPHPPDPAPDAGPAPKLPCEALAIGAMVPCERSKPCAEVRP